ncbi:MAG: ABC transporter permease, partial [Caldilineae bacterium]
MAVAQPTLDIPSRPSRLRRYWDGISIVFESKVATVGLAIVLFWVIVGFVSLVWTPYPPNATMFEQNLLPNSVNWLGTDHLGRDIASRLMAGTQVILLKTRLPGENKIVIPIGVAIWGVLGALVV